MNSREADHGRGSYLMRTGFLKRDRYDAAFRLQSNKRFPSGTQIASQEQQYIPVTTSQFCLPIKGTASTSRVRVIIDRCMRLGVA